MPQTIDFTRMEWEKRPYGRRTDDGFLQIDPGNNTSIGASAEELDRYRFRGHPGILFEHVEHLGYFDGEQNDEFTLLYRFRAKNIDEIIEQRFKRGSKFYSVQTDEAKTGYWHRLENTSNRIILLKIDKENECTQ